MKFKIMDITVANSFDNNRTSDEKKNQYFFLTFQSKVNYTYSCPESTAQRLWTTGHQTSSA